MLDENQNPIGFEVVQDFRMGSWGQICNYRYEQHIQFFSDDRFRVVSGAFGKGCGTNATHRPVVHIDLAVNGDPGDIFSIWDGNQWSRLTNDDYRVPYDEIGHGPHLVTPERYAWLVDDDSGIGYYIEMDVGQFGDGGCSASPFIYPTLHHNEEGILTWGSSAVVAMMITSKVQTFVSTEN